MSSELYGGQDPGALGLHPSSARFRALLDAMWAMHQRKSADYGSDIDPLLNIRKQAVEWKVRPWVAAMMRGGDKRVRLQMFADRGTLVNEGVEDSFLDEASYTILAMILWEEERDSTQAKAAEADGAAKLSGQEHDNAHAPTSDHYHHDWTRPHLHRHDQSGVVVTFGWHGRDKSES